MERWGVIRPKKITWLGQSNKFVVEFYFSISLIISLLYSPMETFCVGWVAADFFFYVVSHYTVHDSWAFPGD